MAEVFAVVCAWCNRVVTAAPAGTLVTHTICLHCLDRTIAVPSLETEATAESAAALLPHDYFGDAFKH